MVPHSIVRGAEPSKAAPGPRASLVALGEEREDIDPPSHPRDPEAHAQAQVTAYRAQREGQAVAGDPGPEKGGPRVQGDLVQHPYLLPS